MEAENLAPIPTPESEVDQLRRENNTLRALLPKLGAPCVYCGFTEIGKCHYGFPGCPQADDILCGDEQVAMDLLKENRDLKKELEQWKSKSQ
jgi:hypothetical protein